MATAADPVAIFQVVQRSYDPAAPLPSGVARDGAVASAVLEQGDGSSGRIGMTTWAGETQAGGRGVGGLTLTLPPGQQAFLGMAVDWSLEEGAQAAGTWLY